MPAQRKEPVIDKGAYTLTDRVKLTWREVRGLASQPDAPREPVLSPEAKGASAPQAAAPAAAAAPAPAPKPAAPREPQPLVLTDEERTAIAVMLAPAVEAAVRQSLGDLISISVNNASARIKADIDRALSGAVAEALSKEVAKLDLSSVIRR
jgi:pyruvate/2-oxoglutarate dehydrogenase complex dihydrolipoamide acyltransferase (E2) component